MRAGGRPGAPFPHTAPARTALLGLGAGPPPAAESLVGPGGESCGEGAGVARGSGGSAGPEGRGCGREELGTGLARGVPGIPGEGCAAEGGNTSGREGTRAGVRKLRGEQRNRDGAAGPGGAFLGEPGPLRPGPLSGLCARPARPVAAVGGNGASSCRGERRILFTVQYVANAIR